MALELVGGALLSCAVQFLFDRICSKEVLAYLRGKSNKSCDLEKLVGKLTNDLTLCMAVIEDAENKQRKSKSVEDWLDKLQDAVFDAEDLLDDIEYEAMRQTTILEMWDKKWHGPEEKDEMESKVKKVLEKFKDIASKKDVLGLQMGVVFGRESEKREVIITSLVDEVFGRDSEKCEVIELLLSDDISNGKLSVVSIEGMGGLGKTTLAQLVFNESEVKEHFDVMAWVCVSEEFDIYKTTKAMLEGVTADTCKVTELNYFQAQLKESLTGKKFLIVLDDVWCENAADLEALCLPLKHGAQGSKILVTTRNEKVSLIMRARVHNLQTLSVKACWELFASKALGVKGDFTDNDGLKQIGQEIVKKCQGLPIALKTLGGLLRSRPLEVTVWKRILESEIWDLPESESNILPALKLSYHYLPSQLKRCFAYCSIFPSDYLFEKRELVLLWMAENFLDCPNKSWRMEDVGDEYFNGLVSRSFFQRSKIDDSRFVMHYLLHDLAKFVSKEYCLLIEEDKEYSRVKVEKVRHVGFMRTDTSHYRRFNNILQSLNLRTFLPRGWYTDSQISIRAVDELLLKLRCLRVLSLSGYTNVNLLPESIGELRQLRSLDLSWTNISSLPESVCKLLNLQTLKLVGCSSLTKLPKDTHHLIKLRYLDLGFCDSLVEMPTQTSKLKNLQFLSTFIVGIDSGTKIGELRELSHLREISIEKLENVGNVKDSSDQARMMDKEHLETLALCWSDDCNDGSQYAKDVLDMLMPNKALKKLQVFRYTGKDFPNWIASEPLRNIVYIQLWKCRNCLSLPPLGQLPTLKELVISGFDALVSVGSEFYGDGCSVKPFPSLESLKFSDMESWESWFNDNSGGFSMLMELKVINCKKLTGDLPFFLPSLTNFTIRNCSKWNIVECCGSLKVESLPQMECCGSIELSGLTSQMSIPIGCLPSTLKKLKVHECSKLEFQFDSPHFSLEQLSISGCCSALRSFPLDFFPMLKEVDIVRLKSLESLSMSDGLQMPSLSSLRIELCPLFKSLPEKMRNLLTSLNKLTISDCPELGSFTQDGLPNSLTEVKVSGCSRFVASRRNWELKRLPNLRLFKIEGSDDDVVESFPEEGLLPVSITWLEIREFPCLKSLDKNGLQQLTSLVYLDICELPKLQEIPGEALPNSLQELTIFGCDELQSISEEGFPTSLESFFIGFCPNWELKRLPASLKELSIWGYDELERMPDQVLRIPLRKLDIRNCPKLNINEFPSSLQQLVIEDCPLLARKCKKEDENKKSTRINIPYIEIDGHRLIRNPDLDSI